MDCRLLAAALGMSVISATAMARDVPSTSSSTTANPFPVDIKAAPASRSPNTCIVAIWVRASGAVQAAQVVSSSGAPRLDEACSRSVINQRFIPAKIDDIAVDKWVTMPIRWELKPPIKKSPAQRPSTDAPIPRLADDQLLHVDPPYYPATALQERKEGICALHVNVSAAGDVENLTLTQTTGNQSLDTACQDALYAAEFVPAKRDGQPVDGATDIWLAWRLPGPATKPP